MPALSAGSAAPMGWHAYATESTTTPPRLIHVTKLLPTRKRMLSSDTTQGPAKKVKADDGDVDHDNTENVDPGNACSAEPVAKRQCRASGNGPAVPITSDAPCCGKPGGCVKCWRKACKELYDQKREAYPKHGCGKCGYRVNGCLVCVRKSVIAKKGKGKGKGNCSNGNNR